MKIGIGKAAEILGVSIETIRRWERAGKILSDRTPHGHRRYDLSKIPQSSLGSVNQIFSEEHAVHGRVARNEECRVLVGHTSDEVTMLRAHAQCVTSKKFGSQNLVSEKEIRKTVAYARVSSHDQKKDLDKQKQVLEIYCASHGWKFEILSDLGSGMNYQKKGLKKLLDEILSQKIARLVITHKDRLLRFGAELIFSICAAKEVEVVIINKGDDTTFEEDLAKDVLEIITVFSARLYGSRSRKNQKLIDGLKKAVDNAH